MSDITVPPSGRQLASTPPTPPAPNKSAVTPPADSTPPTSDSVSLSPAALTAVAAQAPQNPALSETDAQAQSVRLRQQLGNLSLSGTARQNQSILGLLR